MPALVAGIFVFGTDHADAPGSPRPHENVMATWRTAKAVHATIAMSEAVE
jgi:hypothetical protein